MYTISTKLKVILVLVGALCFSVTVALAQGPGFDEDVEDVPVPFDGGVTFITALAAGYGIKKIREHKEKTK
ncbi:MAG: hypothetical protein KDC07_04185 [Chitinophagaceae bacterium]|nr:hypothetical protein [Chitinophagaceae bacterium]MCB9044824.1 hypothetical protein [Chitinophagales bacterium]